MANVEYDLRKYRGVAFVLALFFGPFTWLYTYRFDKWKFWMAVGLDIFGLVSLLFLIRVVVIGFVYLWAIVDVLVKPARFYDRYYLKDEKGCYGI